MCSYSQELCEGEIKNLNFGEIAQRKRGGNGLQHPIATLSRAESDNSKVSRFENVRAFPFLTVGQSGRSLVLVRDDLLYKQLLWV